MASEWGTALNRTSRANAQPNKVSALHDAVCCYRVTRRQRDVDAWSRRTDNVALVVC
jgi:hypothetical protein